MQPEPEVGDDAEVAALAAQAPEQVGVLVHAGPHELPVRGHQVRRQQRVHGRRTSHDPADPAAQCQTSEPGVRHDAGRDGQAVLLGCRIELLEQHPGLRVGHAGVGVDRAAHRAQVDEQAVVDVDSPGKLWPPPRL